MRHNNVNMLQDLQQYFYLLEQQRKQRKAHLEYMFCLMFPDQKIKETVEEKGLPQTIFVNPIDYYCLVDGISRYFKVIPNDELSEGSIIFSWIDESKKYINGEIKTESQEAELDIKRVQEHLY